MTEPSTEVIDIQIIIAGDSSLSATRRIEADSAVTIEDKEKYLVTFSNELGNASLARTASLEDGLSIPQPGSVRESDEAIVTRVNANRREDNPCCFDVEVEYKTSEVQQGDSGEIGTGALRSFRISTDAVETTQQTFYGYKVNDQSALEEVVLTNTLNEPLDPIAEKVIYDEVITVSFTTSFLPTSIINAPIGKMNDDTINLVWTKGGYSRSFGKYKVKLLACPYSSETVGHSVQWNVDVKLGIREDTWLTSYLNESTRIEVEDITSTSGYSRVIATDVNGESRGKVLINDIGREIEDGQALRLDFYLQDEADFSDLMSIISDSQD